jgi:hypothetical protein
MITNLKVFKATLITTILVFGLIASLIITPESKNVSAQRPKLLSFNSYIDLECDLRPLKENLMIDVSVSVPITVRYWTDTPENFLRLIPWQLRNIFLYGTMIVPMQKLHMEVVDKPDWANIYLTQPDILVEIPVGGQLKATEVNTSLILSPRVEAPAQSYTITLKITCETRGRINGYEHHESLDFTPSFVPTIQIVPENPTRTVAPRESVNFKITVKNEGNKKARITPSLNFTAERWSPTINPPFYDVDPGEKGEFIFSIYTPFDFGWHNEIQSFKIDFTAKIFPLREDAPVGGPYSIYLRVNNYGFSTPGFEILTFLAAVVITCLIIKKRYRK